MISNKFRIQFCTRGKFVAVLAIFYCRYLLSAAKQNCNFFVKKLEAITKNKEDNLPARNNRKEGTVFYLQLHTKEDKYFSGRLAVVR